METNTKDNIAHDQLLIQLVNDYQTTLLRMCYLYLHDTALAEDAVQETYLKAYKALPSFRGECSAKSWLIRIAINTCRDMKRASWFRYVDRRVTPDTLPAETIPCAKADEELLLAIMKLSPKYKEVVLLYYYQNMTVKEIASLLTVSLSTVSQRLTHAKKKLRNVLEGGCFDE